MTAHQLAKRLLELPDLQVVFSPACGRESQAEILGIQEVPVNELIGEHIQRCPDCKPTTPTVIEIWFD